MPEKHINYNGLGLNLDSANQQVKEGQVTYALNALVESWDGNRVVYQNEQSNDFHFSFEDNLRPLSVFEISNIDRVLYFLKNESGRNVVAYSDKGENSYTILMEGECLNFDFERPILQVVIKLTNCSTEAYWADNNAMRFFSFEDLPWKEIPDPDNDFKKIKLVGQLDCNKLKVQADFSIPRVNTLDVVEGGSIIEGAYQFTVCYGNSLGEIYSPFFNVTNPLSIKDTDRVTESFNLPTSKAIKLRVDGLDTTGLYDYFNLVVIENVNAISTPRLVGTYPISSSTYEILYTGGAQTNQAIQLSLEQIFQKYQYYDLADGVTSTDDRIVWYNLKEKDRLNYQEIASKIPLYWETVKIPSNGYGKAINTEKYKGYTRGEVYPFELVLILAGGKQTDKFPFRNKSTAPTILFENNEATEYTTYQRGTFDKWESTERYPNNADIWQDWRGEFIQHFKFPEENIAQRLVELEGKKFILSLGVKIEKEDILNAINTSSLTQAQKDEIIGFKVVRGDRASGNMSIVAKGHFSNVGMYKYEGQDYMFPNYPYNDVGIDPLFATHEVEPLRGYDAGKVAQPFDENNPNTSVTFHSPDTHFNQPFGVDSGYIHIDAVDYGKMKGHFIKIKNNAEYKFPTQTTVKVSAALAAAIAFDYTRRKGTPTFNGTDAIAVFTSTQELFEKLTPYKNFGYSINSIAKFDNTHILEEPIIRNIEFGQYLTPGYHSDKDGVTINNYQRESSVYLTLDETIPFAHTLSDEIPEDRSRITPMEELASNIMSMEDFYNLVKSPDGDTNLLVSVINAMQSVATTLSDNANNLSAVLLPILARLFSKQVALNSAESFLAFADISEDCTTEGVYYLDASTIEPPCWTSDACIGKGILQLSVLLTADWGEGVLIRVPDWSGTAISTTETIELDVFADEYEVSDDYPAYLESLDGYPGIEDNLHNINVAKTLMGRVETDYGKVKYEVCGGLLVKSLVDIITLAKQIYESIGEQKFGTKDLTKVRERDVNSYYGSIRKYFPNQWGRIHSYDIVDTGFYGRMADDEFPTIFGGDTYINTFSFKTKVPVFKQTTVNTPDQADVSLDEEGNLGNPMFYISTKPFADGIFKIDDTALANAYSGIGLVNNTAVAGSIIQGAGVAIGASASIIAAQLLVTTGWTGYGAILAVIVAAVGWIIAGVGAIMANKRSKLEKAATRVYKQLFQQVIDRLGFKNINLDRASRRGIGHDGVFYQYVYGIPTYYVESQVNVDYRQATNNNEGNFYPKVGTGIPDDWLQEDRVSIEFDNIYHYNKTYSKQNKENFYSSLREDYDYNKPCFAYFPNRAIWSDKTTLNETLNNWLIYKPLNKFDFPKEFGGLTALNGVLNRQIIARFEDRTQVYNAMTTLASEQGAKVYMGSSDLFVQQPLDITSVDGGSMGSQHKMFLRTEFGDIFIDAKRGQVISLQGQSPKVLSDRNVQKWFAKYLPFEINKYFPQVNIDNHFSETGIHGVYDKFYKRFIITKRDKKLRDGMNLDDIYYENGRWYSNTKRDSIITKYQESGWTYIKQEENKLFFNKKEYVTTLPRNTDIHAYFDTSSMLLADARAAKTALLAWHNDLKLANPTYNGKLYIIALASSGTDPNTAFGDVENATERWLRSAKYSFEGTLAVTSEFGWSAINILPPNFGEVSYTPPQDIIILSFIDECENTVTGVCPVIGGCGYHGQTFPSFGDGTPIDPTQLTLAYNDDLETFLANRYNYTTYKQILYPIKRSGLAVFDSNVLQMVASVEGKILTTSEIAELDASVDLSILLTENPYTTPLKTYGINGIWNKVSPAVSVFSSRSFGTELNLALDMGHTYENIIEQVVILQPIKIEEYFKDYSWTMSYSFLTESWVGWHSYLPTTYISHDHYFQTIHEEGVYNHNKNYNSFCVFYGEQYPYIIEYPFVYKQLDEILQSVSDRSNAYRYEDFDIFYEPDEILYYNKAWIYNGKQNTGLLNLVPRPQNDLSAYLKYPQYETDGKKILIDRKDGITSFNTFWDITKSKGASTFKNMEFEIGKEFNNTNLDYTPRHFKKDKIRSNNVKIRLIRDEETDFKLTSQFIVTDNQTSII